MHEIEFSTNSASMFYAFKCKQYELAKGPELSEGPEVGNPGGQKRKAETEATCGEVVEVSQEILDSGDVLCEAFKSLKENLVKPKPGEEPEDNGRHRS